MMEILIADVAVNLIAIEPPGYDDRGDINSGHLSEQIRQCYLSRLRGTSSILV